METSPIPDPEKQIEELHRINAELAAEIRSLTLGRSSEPRSSAVPAARRIARNDALAKELEEARLEIAHLDQHSRELREVIDEQNRELIRLRSGLSGFLRRVRARLLRR